METKEVFSKKITIEQKEKEKNQTNEDKKEEKKEEKPISIIEAFKINHAYLFLHIVQEKQLVFYGLHLFLTKQKRVYPKKQ